MNIIERTGADTAPQPARSATATAKPQRAVARFLPSFRVRLACCYSASHSLSFLAVFHRFRSIEARDKAKRNCPTTARCYTGFPPSRIANANPIRVFNHAPAATSPSLHSFSFFHPHPASHLLSFYHHHHHHHHQHIRPNPPYQAGRRKRSVENANTSNA